MLSYLLHELLRWSRPDERVDVDVDESGHEELAVETVHDAAVAGDDVAEILRGKKPFILIHFRIFISSVR